MSFEIRFVRNDLLIFRLTRSKNQLEVTMPYLNKHDSFVYALPFSSMHQIFIHLPREVAKRSTAMQIHTENPPRLVASFHFSHSSSFSRLWCMSMFPRPGGKKSLEILRQKSIWCCHTHFTEASLLIDIIVHRTDTESSNGFCSGNYGRSEFDSEDNFWRWWRAAIRDLWCKF